MLIISLVSTIVYLAVVSFSSPIVSSVHYIRVSVMVAFICLALGTYLNVESVDMYHSLFYYSSFTIVIDTLLYLILALVLIGFSSRTLVHSISDQGKAPIQKGLMKANQGKEFMFIGSKQALKGSETLVNTNLKPEYSLILIFSVLGASIMISSSDIISIYVALELQSFGLYILACLRTEEIGSTHASLKYFLLGAISSAFILLGISMVYQEVGSTQLQDISSFLISTGQLVITNHNILSLGILSILCGFMFKISAAPFHSWFADVIQGVPTYTSIVIINLPKISMFTFLFHLLLTIEPQQGSGQELPGPELFIVITTIFSLILGTVAGLMQTKIKRLLAFSTISHVGFLLIGVTATSETSLNAMIFYLVQYTLTVVLTFLVLIAYEFTMKVNPMKHGDSIANTQENKLVNYIVSLQGMGQHSKLLTFTLVLCLFSIAGIPPITGFYAKLGVLNGSIVQNISLVFVTAIICSIISAAYYLKIIKVLMFDGYAKINIRNEVKTFKWAFEEQHTSISPVHSFTISCLTAFLTLFILDPNVFLNCTELVALTIYIT